MSLLLLLIIAVGLAMDVLAVSLGVGSSGRARGWRPMLRLAFHFGLFQGGMTALGWLLGEAVVASIAGWDHWVAMALLAFVGVRMIREGLSPERVAQAIDPTRGGMLVVVCLATSIDAFTVGLGLAMLGVDVLQAALTIGLVSLVLGIAGLKLGGYMGTRFGSCMEILGGLVLIFIGLRIVLTQLT